MNDLEYINLNSLTDYQVWRQCQHELNPMTSTAKECVLTERLGAYVNDFLGYEYPSYQGNDLGLLRERISYNEALYSMSVLTEKIRKNISMEGELPVLVNELADKLTTLIQAVKVTEYGQ